MLSLYAPLLDWLEVHSSMRLSILASYLLSKFVALELLVVNLSAVFKRLRSVLAVAVRPVLLLSREVGEATAWALAGVAPAARAVGLLCTWLAAPFLHGGLTVLMVVKTLLVESFELLGVVLLGPWRLLRMLFGLTRGLVGASKGAATTAAAAHDAGADNWVLLSLRGLSWNPFQASFYLLNRLLKDLKSILNFVVNIVGIVNRHRLSLWNYCHRWWQRRWSTAQQWLIPARSAAAAAAAALSQEPPLSPVGVGENLSDAFDACSNPPSSPTVKSSPPSTTSPVANNSRKQSHSPGSKTASPESARRDGLEATPPKGERKGVRVLHRHSVDGTPRRRLAHSKSLPTSTATTRVLE